MVALDMTETQEIPIVATPEECQADDYCARHFRHESRRADRTPTMEIEIKWWQAAQMTL